MGHQSKRKLEREMQGIIDGELKRAGIVNYKMEKTADQHTWVLFYRDGKPCRVMFSGCADWKARLRVRSILRGTLEGRR